MSDKRYGLVGCGMMGQEHLRNIELLPGASVAAIFEPDPNMAARAKALAPQARLVASLDALLSVEELDAVVIASPNDCHIPQIELISDLRPLPLMVEKPLFSAGSEARRAATLAQTYPAPVWVAMGYRYMPPLAAFIEAIQESTGGVKMLSIREHRFPFLSKVGSWNRFNARTGGTLVEKCVHFFDLMRLIIGQEPIRICASADQAVNHRGERVNGQAVDVWDNAFVLVDFAGGARAVLDLCMFAEGSRFQEEISAAGPIGKIEALVPGPARFWPADLGPLPQSELIFSPRHPKGPRRRSVAVDPVLLAAGDHNGGTYYQHERFLTVLNGGEMPSVTLFDGMRAVEMAMSAQHAAASGDAVHLAPPKRHGMAIAPAV